MCRIQDNFVLVTIAMMVLVANQDESGCGASIQVHHQSTQNDYLINDMPQEKIDQLKLPKDQTLIVRLPSNTLLKYTSYKDVSILHFRIPSDTRTAFFSFKAYEESKSAFQRKCKPRDVTLHLKASSYPVISPENITFPRNFLSADQRFRIYDLQFQSDEEQQRITVEGPQLGNWFAVAFVSWTDPNNDRIEQQGLAASCDTLLLAEMSVSRFHPIIISNGQVHNSTLTSNSHEQNIRKVHNPIHRDSKQNSSHSAKATTSPGSATAATSTFSAPLPSPSPSPSPSPFTSFTDASTTLSSKQPPRTPTSAKTRPPSADVNNTGRTYSNSNFTTNNEIIYKFYVPRNIGVATARITITRVCLQCPDVGFHVQANAFPRAAARQNDESNYAHSAIIKPNQTGEVSIEFYVQPNSWHYALLVFVNATEEPMASTSLTMSEIKLLNKLKKGSAASTLRRDVASAHAYTYTHSSRDLRSQQQQQRLRRQNNTEKAQNVAAGKDTIWYHLEYSLRIDFHKPDDDESGDPAFDAQNGFHPTAQPATASPTVPSTSSDATISPNASSSSNASADNTPNPWRPIRFRDMEFYSLLRQTYREFFMFDYDLVPDANGTVPTVLNLTAGTPAGFTFEIGEVYDIGGTLTFAVSMKHGLKGSNELKNMPTVTQSATERSGILAEKLVGQPMDTEKQSSTADDDKSLPRSNQTIIVCMHLGEPGEPTWPDKCRYGRKLLPASSIVNNTDSNTSTGLVHVPFPESGQWYVTMGLYCHGAETAARVTIIDSVKEFVKKHANMLEDMRSPCACSASATGYLACVSDRKCLQAMNETETLKVKECLMDSKCTSNYLEMTRQFEIHHKFATEQHFALDNCNTSVVFTISSSPCVAGRCGRFGRCYHYMSGGFVFSTCVCMKGYRGWDCTEDTQVPSSISILMASLLLTLSNLLFFPSIYMAVRRKYYTEAIIYFFAMFFSIFYHACDSGEDEYSFCLVKIGVLQFCDFYCGLLAIWVTLVAMAHIRQQFVSLLHMFGAILLAFGTELNKQSLWVFLAPALTGICIISTSWGLRCYKSRKWFPARKYLTVYMPLGTVLVMVGLICYAFLQTKQNYHIVHSIWHMVMALSILCLLPSRKSFMPKC